MQNGNGVSAASGQLVCIMLGGSDAPCHMPHLTNRWSYLLLAYPCSCCTRCVPSVHAVLRFFDRACCQSMMDMHCMVQSRLWPCWHLWLPQFRCHALLCASLTSSVRHAHAGCHEACKTSVVTGLATRHHGIMPHTAELLYRTACSLCCYSSPLLLCFIFPTVTVSARP
jgi:hypothetical protein